MVQAGPIFVQFTCLFIACFLHLVVNLARKARNYARNFLRFAQICFSYFQPHSQQPVLPKSSTSGVHNKEQMVEKTSEMMVVLKNTICEKRNFLTAESI